MEINLLKNSTKIIVLKMASDKINCLVSLKPNGNWYLIWN